MDDLGAALLDAMQRPGLMVFLDGRNEYGSHVIPSLPCNVPDECVAEITDYEDGWRNDLAESILKMAEECGFVVGQDHVWVEMDYEEPQYGEYGRVELRGYWFPVCINAAATEALNG